MMPCLVAVGFSFLVEMEIDEEVSLVYLRIGVKPWIARTGEGTDEAHLITVFPLEGISRTAEKSDGIIGRLGDDDFHTIGSETMIGHHEW